MLGRKRHHDEQVAGEATVLDATATGGQPGDAGYSAVVWHVKCRLFLDGGREVDFEQKIGNAFRSAWQLSIGIGDTLPVHYDPADPTGAKVDVDELEARHQAFVEDRDEVMRNQAIHGARQAQREQQAAPQVATAAGAFRFVVSDVIFSMGKTRVLGDVKAGGCKVGDRVLINGERAAVVIGINAFLKDLPETTPGLSCALELGAVDSGQIFKGDVITQ